MKYICELCGLVYDEEAGYPARKIAPGTPFADLPADFACPSCGSDKESFFPQAPKQTISPRAEASQWNYDKYADPIESQR